MPFKKDHDQVKCHGKGMQEVLDACRQTGKTAPEEQMGRTDISKNEWRLTLDNEKRGSFERKNLTCRRQTSSDSARACFDRDSSSNSSLQLLSSSGQQTQIPFITLIIKTIRYVFCTS